MADLGAKEYAYLAMIALLFVGFGWWTYHERNEQRQHDASVEIAAAAKEASHVKAIEDAADVKLSALQNKLDDALLTPVTPGIVVRVCASPAATSAPNRAASTAAPSDAVSGPSVGVGSSDQGEDIAPLTEAILARDKAVIDYLQGYIRTCQQAGVCQKESP